jgi:SAM-dependent methyltransferase
MGFFKTLERKVRHTIRFDTREAAVPIQFRVDQARRYPNCRGLDDFLKRNAGAISSGAGQRTLDLGCGVQPKNPFKAELVSGIDIMANPGKDILSADLSVDPIPFPDGHFNFVTAFDFIEHVPRVICIDRKTRFAVVELMNEVDRVLAKGGLFLSHTPAYPSQQAFQDPTHVNIITEETFPGYFCRDLLFAKSYGFKGDFELVAQAWHSCWLLTLMRKI